MSNFINKLEGKLEELKNLIDDEEHPHSQEVQEIIDWLEDEWAQDADDILKDFETEQIGEFWEDHIKTTGSRHVTLSDINAESEFDELMESFKSKHILTIIS